MRITRTAPALILLFAAAVVPTKGVSSSTPGEHRVDEDATSAAVARAEAAAGALGKGLLERLTQELHSGSAADAVRVCSEVAPQLARAHSGDGLTVRRISLKARNPANVPDTLEREVLVEMQALHADERRPVSVTRVVETEGRAQLRWFRPIVVASTCLRCHGAADEIDPEVRAILAERYPEDRATGYAVGDLRGAFSVTVQLD
jgi:cytochrome c5